MYLTLFIFCGICLQGIMGSFTEENNKKTLDIHIREKRLIDLTSGGNQRVSLESEPYVVQIKEDQMIICAGAILLPDIIITCAHCVFNVSLSEVSILSGSAVADMGTPHRIIEKIEDSTFDRNRYWDDLIMLVIFPPIDIVHSTNRPIELHEGPIPINEFATVSGWGCNSASDGDTFPGSLRSIRVPLISRQVCQDMFRGIHVIKEQNICTYDRTRMKRCSFGDSGNPLVVDHKLIGIHAWNARFDPQNHPDVYMNLVNPIYNKWIKKNLAKHLRKQGKQGLERVRHRLQPYCCTPH